MDAFRDFRGCVIAPSWPRPVEVQTSVLHLDGGDLQNLEFTIDDVQVLGVHGRGTHRKHKILGVPINLSAVRMHHDWHCQVWCDDSSPPSRIGDRVPECLQKYHGIGGI